MRVAQKIPYSSYFPLSYIAQSELLVHHIWWHTVHPTGRILYADIKFLSYSIREPRPQTTRYPLWLKRLAWSIGYKKDWSNDRWRACVQLSRCMRCNYRIHLFSPSSLYDASVFPPLCSSSSQSWTLHHNFPLFHMPLSFSHDLVSGQIVNCLLTSFHLCTPLFPWCKFSHNKSTRSALDRFYWGEPHESRRSGSDWHFLTGGKPALHTQTTK